MKRSQRSLLPQPQAIFIAWTSSYSKFVYICFIYGLNILWCYIFLQLFHGPDQNLQRGLPYNHVPFRPAGSEHQLLIRIHHGERPIRDRYNYIPDQYWTLITHCWAGDPLTCPTIAKVWKSLWTRSLGLHVWIGWLLWCKGSTNNLLKWISKDKTHVEYCMLYDSRLDSRLDWCDIRKIRNLLKLT